LTERRRRAETERSDLLLRESVAARSLFTVPARAATFAWPATPCSPSDPSGPSAAPA